MTDRASPEQRPESPEVAARPVLFTALALLAFVGLSIGGARVYYVREIRAPVNVAPETFKMPRLQIDEAADLAKFEKEQQTQLSGYAWVDRNSGIIQVPIDRAVAIVIAKGAGAYGPLKSPTAVVESGGTKH